MLIVLRAQVFGFGVQAAGFQVWGFSLKFVLRFVFVDSRLYHKNWEERVAGG